VRCPIIVSLVCSTRSRQTSIMRITQEVLYTPATAKRPNKLRGCVRRLANGLMHARTRAGIHQHELRAQEVTVRGRGPLSVRVVLHTRAQLLHDFAAMLEFCRSSCTIGTEYETSE
jgi:hypothetical protein